MTMQLLTIVGGDLGELKEPAKIKGRLVVATEWLVAYLEHGVADELIVLTWNSAQRTAIEEELGRYGSPLDRLHFHPIELLPDLLRRLSAPLFFHGDPLIHQPKRVLRNLHPERVIPVVGITHTLSTDRIVTELASGYPLDACDAILCTSRAAQEVVGRLCPSVERPVIPLGIFPERLGPGDPALASRLPNRPIVLVHGRINLSDKMDLVGLIEHWPTVVARSRRQPILVISGASDDASTLEIYRQRAASCGASDDLLLLPNITAAERATLLARAEIFCSPSDNLQETFGLSLLEAMASGCAIVAADWSGYRDLVEPGQQGYLVPTLWGSASRTASALGPLVPEQLRSLWMAQQVVVDLDGLTERLVELLSNPGLREQMAASGRRRVAEAFHWRVVMAKQDALFATLCERARTIAPSPLNAPRLDQIFASLAAQQLEESTRITLTPHGIRIFSGSEAPFLYVDVPWQRAILGLLKFTDAPEGRSVADLLRPLGDDWLAHERGTALLLWMLKRGWLKVVTGTIHSR